MEAHSCNHYCSGKAINITYCVCVCVCSHSYPSCDAHGPYYQLGPLRFYNIFANYLINGKIFWRGGGGVTKNKMCFDFLYNFCPKHFSF